MRSSPPRIHRLTQTIRFFKVARLLLWTIWVIYRERRRVIRAHERGNYEVQPDIEVLIDVLSAFRQTAIKLGVLMIKLGQFLSTRADLLPERALVVLAALQDEVPPEPFEHVVSVIESELKKPVGKLFTSIEPKAAAAASLGQVHKAVLASTGATVAVKVQRPHIDQLVRMDLSTLKFVIWLITRFFDTSNFIDLWGFYREFRRVVFEEIDFLLEATNAERFREIFKDDPTIYIPRVYDYYVTHHVMVLEWIDGIKINDYARLDTYGIDRMEVARRTVSSYFHQIFEAGLFHADPHPGNIFVKRGSDPARPVIAFVDFGMVGTVTRPMKHALKEVFVGVVTRDVHLLVTALVRLGFIGPGANLIEFERDISMLLDQYYGITLGEFRDLNMQEVMQEVIELLYNHPFHIPAQFAFTGRAVSTLVGVATGLAPDFDFFAVATPYARRFLGLDIESAGETAQELLRQLWDTSRVLVTLPRTLERLITRIEGGQIEVRLANLSLGKRNGRGKGNDIVIGGGSGLARMVIFISSLAGGVYLSSIHDLIPAWFCLGLSAVIALSLLFKHH